ncbi:uncharacterized protein LOC18444211 isoform X2 [Amborella trichopoda]|uniref:uncharacterized protein LOC18444211 isoform X2 n=1 Tax=Amborella trichopoda TaxID=13333 RepID=UPI0005D3586E|nr:uncharacterized protein LOC18444211 isoform X2 [Amborella trichopoda]|eukprot:XP_011627061.1 uncharacterized protein LOC18444211 isoform X2 [Amborella trichopoda]
MAMVRCMLSLVHLRGGQGFLIGTLRSFFAFSTLSPLFSCFNACLPLQTRNSLKTVQLRYIRESEAIRRAMVPLELIKRVKEIQQEPYIQPETVVQRKAPKQNSASDLSKRLKDLQALNDANSKKALDEWRKRKMGRAKQREMEKNMTAAT